MGKLSRIGLLVFGCVGCLFDVVCTSEPAYGSCSSSAANEPMRQACYSGVRRPGAAWINGSEKYSTTDYIQVDSAQKSGIVTAYMHGAVYGLRGDNFAVRIQLCTGSASWTKTHYGGGRSNKCNGYSTPSWITGYASSFYRGYSSGGWSYCPNNGNCGGYVKIDIAKFVASAVSASSSGGYTTYTNYVWFARCANGWWGGGGSIVAGYCGGDYTYAADKITAKIRIKSEEVKDVSVSPSASLSGTAYIGETAPTPSFSYTDSATISLGNSTSTGSIEDMNKKLSSLHIVKETKEVAFYVSDSHNGTSGSSPGAGSSRLSSKTYSGGDVASWACTQFGAAAGRCYENNTGSAQKIDNAEDLVGYKFCVAGVARVGVQENGNTTWKDWQISGASCIPIAKKTSVGIAGNSVYANNGVKTIVVRKSGGTAYGSWAEFLIATGTTGISGNTTNIGTSSGGGLYSGLSGSVRQSDKAKWSPESVGNKSMSDQNVPAAKISVSNSFSQQVKKIVDDNDNPNLEVRRVSSITSDIINNQSPSKQIIIYSDGNLSISNNVKQIDAWIIAPNGTVDTCSDAKVGTMTSNQCGNRLIINGLVYAKGITLDRTYGGTSNDLAEIINLTPASYVWAYNQASSTYANPTTVYTRELAPRT